MLPKLIYNSHLFYEFVNVFLDKSFTPSLLEFNYSQYTSSRLAPNNNIGSLGAGAFLFCIQLYALIL